MKVRVFRVNGFMEPEYLATVEADEKLLHLILAALTEQKPVYLEPVVEP